MPRTSDTHANITKCRQYGVLTERLNTRVSRLKTLAQRPGDSFLFLDLCEYALTKLFAMDFPESLICGAIYGFLLVHVMLEDGRENWEVQRALGIDDQARFERWVHMVFGDLVRERAVVSCVYSIRY